MAQRYIYRFNIPKDVKLFSEKLFQITMIKGFDTEKSFILLFYSSYWQRVVHTLSCQARAGRGVSMFWLMMTKARVCPLGAMA